VLDAALLLLNTLGRRAIILAMRAAAALLRWRIDRYIDDYPRAQAALKARYGIDDGTPIRGYTDETRAAVEAWAARHPGARFAYTSGSTSEPKKIAYTRARLRELVAGNISVLSRLMRSEARRAPLGAASLFILSGLKDDDSLSTLLLSPGDKPVTYLDGLVTPSKYLTDPRFAATLDEYGATAARLFALVVADPALIYSTNPSTLALFLAELHHDWPGATRLIRDYVDKPASFAPGVHAIRRRAAAPGWRARLSAVAAAAAPLPPWELFPSLRAYCCWDGGYVRPFLEQIHARLPEERYRLVPMYSMSTETIETLNYFDGDDVRFLPIGPRILYELLPEGAPDEPASLLTPGELEVGETYCMVTSDRYGLTRYLTEDLFRCEGTVRGVPDLRFLRRRGIQYSFTGEKLTGEQLTEAFAELRDAHPGLRAAGVQTTLIPSQPDPDAIPGYKLILAHPGPDAPADLEPPDVAATLDRLLSRINRELAAKLESRRLAPTVAIAMPYDALAARLDPKTRDDDDAARRTYDNQFKLLPLYSRLWEELAR
jgi:hypothetical protein